MDKNGSAVKDILIVTLITLVAGTLLGAVYNITKEPIAYGKQKARTESQQKVFSDAASFESAKGADDAGYSAKKPQMPHHAGIRSASDPDISHQISAANNSRHIHRLSRDLR